MKRRLRRYANRKLYDLMTRRYVALSDVANMVHKGMEVEVHQAGTNVDMTGYVLAQAISSTQRDLNSIGVVKTLHKVLRMISSETQEENHG